jgi:hypothetical protein
MTEIEWYSDERLSAENDEVGDGSRRLRDKKQCRTPLVTNRHRLCDIALEEMLHRRDRNHRHPEGRFLALPDRRKPRGGSDIKDEESRRKEP